METGNLLPKRYDPRAAEKRWYSFWLDKGYFHSKANPAKKPYCIVIPPPYVTGALHMGHALNNTLQDILIRYKRMDGFNVVWVPGTDHAGIATQWVVRRDGRCAGVAGSATENMMILILQNLSTDFHEKSPLVADPPLTRDFFSSALSLIISTGNFVQK